MLHAKIQTHQNNKQKISGTIMKILGGMVTWCPEFVQAL
jgi:hypothetical protein